MPGLLHYPRVFTKKHLLLDGELSWTTFKRSKMILKRVSALTVGAAALLLMGSLCWRKDEPQFEIENISSNQSTSHRPSIACSDDGRVALAWSDYATGWEEVWLVEKEQGGRWTEPANISKAGNANGSRSVTLCFGTDGSLHAAWSQAVQIGQSGAWVWAIAYARRPSGGEWAVPETIHCGTAVEPHVAVDASGTVHLAFHDMVGGYSTICYTSRSPSGIWSSIQEVSARHSAGVGGFALLHDGTAIAAWDDRTGSPVRILWSERIQSGGWSAPALVYPSSVYCQSPVLASNGSKVALAFGESKQGGRIVVMTKQKGAAWSEPDTSCETRNAGMESVALSKQGHVFLGFGNAAEPALRLARRNSGWTQAKVTDSLYPSKTTLAVDDEGRAHLAWASEADYDTLTGFRAKDVFYVEIVMDSLW